MAIPSDTLIDEAKCYICLGITQAEAIELALLNRIASAAGSGGGVPSGVILMWSGTIATIPTGWALCNGALGTPDLRNRFVVAADADSGGQARTTLTGAATQSGGSISHTHTITDPQHDHTFTEELLVNVVAPTASAVGFDTGAVNLNATGITVNSQSAPQPYFALAYIMKL